jgi:hypothetical protein
MQPAGCLRKWQLALVELEKLGEMNQLLMKVVIRIA